MGYHLKEERYIFPLIIILWLCNNYIINYYAISCKILTKISCFMFIQMVKLLQFLNQHSMISKTVSHIFPVMFQPLLKPQYVDTAWLHKISPNLIVCRICSINSIRNHRHGFADNRSKNNIYENQASMCTNAGANLIQSRHFMSKIVVEKSQKL